MSFQFKNKKHLKLITGLTLLLNCVVMLFWFWWGDIWVTYNYQALDLIYQKAVKKGYGPKSSQRIIYVPITDDTYTFLQKNYLQRSLPTQLNNICAELGAEAVIYDIIFAYPGTPEEDQKFVESISNNENVYLPIGVAYSNKKIDFNWLNRPAFKRLQSEQTFTPTEIGNGSPFIGSRAITQMDAFATAAKNTGHISLYMDPDGIHRHLLAFIKLDDRYIPTIGLSVFCDYLGVSPQDITIHWGKHIIIPTKAKGILDKDIIIPIDEAGRIYIPFVEKWLKDFPVIEAHKLIQYFEDENMWGNLAEYIESSFVFIGDVSTGLSDLGPTPLEDKASFIMIHTAFLNSLLTQTFYSKVSFTNALLVIIILGMTLGLSFFPKSSKYFYLTGIFIVVGLTCWTFYQFTQFVLFPLVSIVASLFFIFLGITIGFQIIFSKDRQFIIGAFSKYLPAKVVAQLLHSPELLKLGGEEKTITMLFSDIANFTMISETMSPTSLVHFLNEYLTEMTDIIIEEGGIIDKYQGDAIMAEFGAPLSNPLHADMAVKSALRMQNRLKQLRVMWNEKGLPALRCRIGINTGRVTIGNMGSRQVFDYTVIGDDVNLASRLEGANKNYQTYLMISKNTLEQLTPNLFKTRILDAIIVKGKSKAVKVYEVYGHHGDDFNEENEQYYQTYDAAFHHYLNKEFVVARQKFDQALALKPGDIAAKNMITRIEKLLTVRLPKDWDGSIALTSK